MLPCPPRAENPNQKLTIIRGPKVAHYFVVDNALFCDERLSWEARGLMGYLLSKPDDWKVRLYDLVARGPAGVHKIQRILPRTGGRRLPAPRAPQTVQWGL